MKNTWIETMAVSWTNGSGGSRRFPPLYRWRLDARRPYPDRW